jgi:hypothetical protein
MLYLFSSNNRFICEFESSVYTYTCKNRKEGGEENMESSMKMAGLQTESSRKHKTASLTVRPPSSLEITQSIM